MTERDRTRPDTDLEPERRPGLEKDPDEWVTGDEPMTGAQASYLETLSRQTGERVRHVGLVVRTGRRRAKAGRLRP